MKKVPIVVKLHGGAGNQLFQLAFALWLGKQTNCEVRLDEWLIDLPERGIRRNCVIEECAASRLLLPARKYEWLLSILSGSRFARSRAATIIRRIMGVNLVSELETEISNDLVLNRIVRNQQNIFIGYWQNYRFASEVQGELLELLDWKISADDICAIIGEQIAKTETAVSLHVRRGDYTKMASAPVLDINYYHRAIVTIIDHLATQKLSPAEEPQKITLFVFSDDLQWCKSKLPAVIDSIENDHFSISLVFVDGNNSQNAHKDLCLMRSCRHHILANSTFSWWGAWINPRVDKAVVIPHPWMPDRKPYERLFPEEWIKVDSGF